MKKLILLSLCLISVRTFACQYEYSTTNSEYTICAESDSEVSVVDADGVNYSAHWVGNGEVEIDDGDDAGQVVEVNQ
ncbi:hypothetical protein ACLIKC_01480 [Klebsiella aerogenes]|uniref:hypothetical protein n=1 Tax=Klebsiella aerogenes TaxID=548 RepID=UPI003A9090AE